MVATLDRSVFRSHPLDGSLLHFQPSTGTNVRIESGATRVLRRKSPRVAMFGITNQCNLACEFCSRDTSRESRWTVESAAQVLRDLAEAGVLEVAFGGGEPLAFRGFSELVAELHHTTALALNVTTNGILIRDHSWPAFAGRFGQVRISIYEDARWRVAARVLSRAGQKWGANVIVDDTTLATLPERLAELTALDAGDVSLLSYVGPDASKHLDDVGRARLAAIIDDAPLPCRLSVCFGDRVPVHRLFDGDCGAGLDFVSITPDQRVQSCSFQDESFPGSTAAEILEAWRDRRDALTRPSTRSGCSRSLPLASSRPAPPIAIWQAFSGNNSGECVMVAKFESVSDAEKYLAKLLPGFVPDVQVTPTWSQLFLDEGVSLVSIEKSHRETPRELVAFGRSVLAVQYDAADPFPELRGLAWKMGAHIVPGGVHVHDGEMTFLVGARARNAADVDALKKQALPASARVYTHGEVVFAMIPIFGRKTQGLESLAEARELTLGWTGDRRFAVEMLFHPYTEHAIVDVKKRLAVDTDRCPRLVVWFWGEHSEDKAASFARLVEDRPVTVAGSTVLVDDVPRRKRLAVLAYRRGAFVEATDGRRVAVNGVLTMKTPRTRGEKRVVLPPAPLRAALRAHLGAKAELVVRAAPAWGAGPSATIWTTEPGKALVALREAAVALDSIVHTGVSDIEPLAFALRRLIDELHGPHV